MKVEFKPLTKEEYIIKRTGKIPKEVKKQLRSTVSKIVGQVAKDERRNLTRQRTGLLAKSLGSTVKTLGNENIVGRAGARAGFRVTLNEAVKASTGKTSLQGLKKDGKAVKLKGRIHATRTRGEHKGEAVKLSPGNYVHLVERGHKKGRGRSAAQAYPFIAKAADEANRKATGDLNAAVVEGVRTP